MNKKAAGEEKETSSMSVMVNGWLGAAPIVGGWTTAADVKPSAADLDSASSEAAKLLAAFEPSAPTPSLFSDNRLLTAAARRMLGGGSPKYPGGPNGFGGGGNGRGPSKTAVPFYHLTRVTFQPGAPAAGEALFFDRKLLEVVHSRLGRVITDAVLVVGKPLVFSRSLRDLLNGSAAADPDRRFAELGAQAQGRLINATPVHGGAAGFPVARLSLGEGTGAYSIRQYLFYQSEGSPILVTYKSREGNGSPRRRFYVTDEALREELWNLEREMERIDRQEVRNLVEALYAEGLSSAKQESFIAFFQGFALLLEARPRRRYPPEFFDALWRLIYQVRLAGPPSPEREPVMVEESYQEVRPYLAEPEAAV
ncbi:MAG: hypothetical protein HY609_04285 [Deltaproteobacteria bacterium]|nr:hypothetical protein [Deltaproteobacteria bacterium]MBI4224128.1 hypothetical protein [Deltaproteobacteria bacterium]